MRWKGHEVIEITGEGSVVSSNPEAHGFASADAARLGPGFYVVLMPNGKPGGRWTRRARYFGPHADRSSAALLGTSAAALALTAADRPPQTSVERPSGVATARAALRRLRSGQRVRTLPWHAPVADLLQQT
jgi:hypothetical protein